MKRQTRDHLLLALATMEESVKKGEKTKDLEERFQILKDCSEGLDFILSILKKGFSESRYLEYEEFFAQLQELLETMNALSEQGEKTDKVHRVIRKALIQLKEELQKDPEVGYEVVFMPYKLSMWDSLESIWRAAKEDPSCQCYVVPIPYYDRDDQGRMTTLHYEGVDFPSEIEVIHYDDFDLATRKPDVIYIHNPYDENNIVTSVAPQFYSYELKKYTKNLVYVPYCLHRYVSEVSSSGSIYKMITQAADFAICQNEKDREIYRKVGVDPKKLLPLGSPKLDDVAYLMQNPPLMPESWAEKMAEKKVILYNLSIDFVLNHNVDYIYDQINQILEEPELILLFRPHPLLETTFQSMRKEMYQQYLGFMKMLEQHPRVVIDREKTVYPGFYYSHGLITTQSSLMCNYILTEKPMLVLQTNPYRYQKWNKTLLVTTPLYDFSKAYYPTIVEPYLTVDKIVKVNKPPFFLNIQDKEVDGKIESIWTYQYPNENQEEIDRIFNDTKRVSKKINGEYYVNPSAQLQELFQYNESGEEYGIHLLSLEDFFQTILEDKDSLKEERVQTFRESAINCDGNNGKNIHKTIMERMK